MTKASFSITGFGDEISPDLDVQLAALRRMGLEALDLRTAFGKNVLALTDTEVDEVADHVRDHGLRVQCIGSPVNKCPYTPEGREEQFRKLERAVAIAKCLGTSRIRVFTPETDPNGGSSAWPEVKAWVADQVALATSAGITLMHENDGRFFGAFPSNAKLLFEEFGGPSFRAVYDPGNAVLIGTRTMRDWFPWLLPHLDTVHIKDGRESEGKFVNAGEGDGEMVAMFRFLIGQGWNGPLTMEPHAKVAGSAGGFSGEELFGQAVDALRKVLDEAVA
jgi:sugar phosphate isomerase/epimerase